MIDKKQFKEKCQDMTYANKVLFILNEIGEYSDNENSALISNYVWEKYFQMEKIAKENNGELDFDMIYDLLTSLLFDDKPKIGKAGYIHHEIVTLL